MVATYYDEAGNVLPALPSKKSPAQLQREIDEVLTGTQRRSHATKTASGKPSKARERFNVDQPEDKRPGFYYVTAIDAGRSARASGPYKTHAEALDDVRRVKETIEEMDPRAIWWAWGTMRSERNLGPGFLESSSSSASPCHHAAKSAREAKRRGGASMEARHESGSIIPVARAYDLRTLKLLSDSGYTHVRAVNAAGEPWGWEPIATAIDSATPSTVEQRAIKNTRQSSHATKKSAAARRPRQSDEPFWIAPAGDPRDRYAAGYDGNHFRTRREAQRAIASLRSHGGEFDVPWVINKD